MLTVDRQMGLNIVHPDGKVTFLIYFAGTSIYLLLACKNLFYSIIL